MDKRGDRARCLIGKARDAGLSCRALGGIAVHLLCPETTATAPLRREFNDLDLITVREDVRRLSNLLEGSGVLPERRFNLLHGDKRLLFYDTAAGRHVDVFIDSFEMCHRLDLRGRLDLTDWSLSASDLLLTKLQVARLTNKDITDIASLMLERETPLALSWFDAGYIGQILGSDWGWWKTVTDNLAVAAASLAALDLDDRHASRAAAALDEISSLADSCDKTRRWRLRSRLGTRIPWREEPEEARR